MTETASPEKERTETTLINKGKEFRFALAICLASGVLIFGLGILNYWNNQLDIQRNKEKEEGDKK